MSTSPYNSPLRQEGHLPSPPQQMSPTISPTRTSPRQIISVRSESALKETIGCPLRSLLREKEILTLPGPTSPPVLSKNASKSPSIDALAADTSVGSLPEHDGRPVPRLQSSPEKRSMANRMAAGAAPMDAKARGGRGNVTQVESVVAEWEQIWRAELGLRVLEMVFCLISFSVMAADKTRGWAGDSFDRYQEFRYCISMNIIAFVYSGYQACAQIHHRIKRRPIIDRPLSYYLDFFMDQVLAYLLVSASSAAATRNDDWISMFGSNEFTDKMNGSIAMSFLAFFAFAFSAVVSAYKLFSWNP